MDFFANQDQARRKTKYLVLIFLLAVVVITCLANVVVYGSFWFLSLDSTYSGPSVASYYNWETFGLVCLAVNVVILLAIIYKRLQLSDGGKSVAESLGGRRIQPNSTDPKEKKLLNVVEEMALASGMPVPPVYLLEQERGINAFAAGRSPADAVIGITRGSLDNFNREQLQGVIAHEFSHILNGDMRLNLRLIALLNGILFIGHCGKFLLNSNRYTSTSWRRTGGGRTLLIGVALYGVGMIGMFFGGLIKAAINRQREFLADASAVQFTRNPQSIGDALKIIGGYSRGSRLLSFNAEESSHLFISNGLGSFALFKTHPPLEERIRRIEPRWDGEMLKPSTTAQVSGRQEKKNAEPAAVTAALVGSAVESISDEPVQSVSPNDLPLALMEKLRDPLTATAAMFALLLDEDQAIRNKQLQVVQQYSADGTEKLCIDLSHELKHLDPAYRLVIIERSMPSLKCLSKEQYLAFRRVIKTLIHSDNRIDFFEWCFFQLMRRYLGSEYGDQRKSKPRFKSISEIGDQYGLVVSALIYHCHTDTESQGRAFARGANTAGLYNNVLVPKANCTIEKFIAGVNDMADCYPLLKGRMLKGLLHVIEFDGKVTPEEKELITAIAASIESPLPRNTIL